ncbi:MAG: DUF2752 domain-containing protein [Eubacterium sp.]|nr:DUF2752 domain-containing protein [Eubacterium sp.]
MKLDDVQKKILLIYLMVIASAVAIYAFLRITHISLECPVYQMSGIYCPGCGLSRCGLNFFKLDFYASFRDHPGLFVGMVVWIVISVFAFVGKPKVFRDSKVLIRILYITLALYLIFSILRNIPGFEFLQPID